MNNEDSTFSKVIGVVGSGLMGCQLTVFFAERGYDVILITRKKSKSDLDDIIRKIMKSMKSNQYDIEKRITITPDYTELGTAGIIIETVIENLAVKKDVINEISLINQDAIIASNSSSLSIDVLSQSALKPENLIGMHFFNPVHKMDLVEVVYGKYTSKTVKETIINLVEFIGKTPISIPDVPGRIVNRLLIPQINEAIKMHESGTADIHQIDRAVKLGLNHPMGPFKLADYIGLDVCLSILTTMSEHFQNPMYDASISLKKKVKEGKLGIKTGEGFYKYGE